MLIGFFFNFQWIHIFSDLFCLVIIINVITWQLSLAAKNCFVLIFFLYFSIYLCTCLMSNTYSTGVVLHWQCQHCDAAKMNTMKAVLLLPACRSLWHDWHCAPTQSEFTAGRYRQFSLNLPITQFCLIVFSTNWELPSHNALVGDPWMELWHVILILLALCLN